MIAPTIRWPNARRRLQAAQRSATPIHITLELWGRRDQTIGVIAAYIETILVRRSLPQQTEPGATEMKAQSLRPRPIVR
jgi:hypothetical protein